MDRAEDRAERQVIRIVAVPCRNCGKPIEVISPTWYTTEWDFRDRENPRFVSSYEPDETALCIACCLGSKSPDERLAWDHHLNRLLQRKILARVPPGATLFHLRDQNTHIFERTDSVHHFDYFFMISHHEPQPDWRVPRTIFRPHDGSPPTVHIVVGVDVTLEGVAAAVQVTWNAEILAPGHSTMQIVNWQRSTHEDLKRLMEGTRFLFEGAGLWRGRPPKRTTLSREVFLSQYQEALEQCLREGRRPTDNNLLMSMTISKATLTRYRKKWLSKDESITDAM